MKQLKVFEAGKKCISSYRCHENINWQIFHAGSTCSDKHDAIPLGAVFVGKQMRSCPIMSVVNNIQQTCIGGIAVGAINRASSWRSLDHPVCRHC